MICCGLTIFGVVAGIRKYATCNLRGWWWWMKICSLFLRGLVPSIGEGEGRDLDDSCEQRYALYISLRRKSSDDWGSGCFYQRSLQVVSLPHTVNLLVWKVFPIELYHVFEELGLAEGSFYSFLNDKWTLALDAGRSVKQLYLNDMHLFDLGPWEKKEK